MVLPIHALSALNLVASAALLVSLAACGERDASVEVPVATEAAEISWFAGSVQQAFDEARATDRPIFLFWGAQWCPYCQQLKTSVFTRRDFVEKSRQFVSVYLDGDDPGAQKWGETLRVSGYPTVLILRPDGTELMRVAGGMDVERYTGLLDLALGQTRPIADILAGLGAEPRALNTNDCRRLAFHGFGLEPVSALDDATLAQLLWSAAESCPTDAQLERDRLRVLATLSAVAAASDTIKGRKVRGQPTLDMIAEVVELLGQTSRAVAVADTLFMLDEQFFAAARSAQLLQDADLLQRWMVVMDATASDVRYSESDQLYALKAKLRGAKTFNALSPQLERNARELVDAALKRQHDPDTRASVVNATLHVMDALDDRDAVYAIAEREMRTSTTPYYYMLDLANIDEQRGRFDAALGWLERAYTESRGPATRFQWGTSYVAGLIRMQPQDEARIRETTLKVLAELDGPDRFHQRTNARIERLGNELAKWNADGSKAATLKTVQAHMQDLCMRIPEAEAEARESCSGFVKRVAAAPVPAVPAPV